jgi:hypothetical protein
LRCKKLLQLGQPKKKHQKENSHTLIHLKKNTIKWDKLYLEDRTLQTQATMPATLKLKMHHQNVNIQKMRLQDSPKDSIYFSYSKNKNKNYERRKDSCKNKLPCRELLEMVESLTKRTSRLCPICLNQP